MYIHTSQEPAAEIFKKNWQVFLNVLTLSLSYKPNVLSYDTFSLAIEYIVIDQGSQYFIQPIFFMYFEYES